jgi:hypothetical protein
MISALLPLSVGAAMAQKASTARSATKTTAGTKASPSAKAQPGWKFSRASGLAKFEFAVPGADEAVVTFSCQPNSGLVRVVSHLGSRGVRPGDGAAIRLINGKNKFEVAGTAFSTPANESVDVGGVTRIDPKLFSLFRSGETIVLDVAGRKRNLSVANARTGADAFEKACGAERQAGG